MPSVYDYVVQQSKDGLAAWQQAAQQAQMVEPLIVANYGIILQFITANHDLGASIEPIVTELNNKVPGSWVRYDILGSLLFNGGFSIIEIVQFYQRQGVAKDPAHLLYLLQSAGFSQEQINYAMTQLGGAYVQYGLSQFIDLNIQKAIPLVGTALNQAQKIPVVGKPIAKIGNEVLNGAQTAVNAVAKGADPRNWH